jgi:hypothetical protein
MPIKKNIVAAAVGAVTAGAKKAKEGGTGREITQAAVGGAGVPSFGGARDRVVGQAYDAAASGIKKAKPAIAGAVQEAIGRTQNFIHGIGKKDDNA